MPPVKIPPNLSITVEAHKKWLSLLTEAQELVDVDVDLQAKSAKGFRLKERSLPPEVLGRYYAQYCDVINKMYDAYLNNVHLQRAPYMLEIISVLLKRMYELRNEIVHLIVNDYIYVDSGLVKCRLTPSQIQIVIPYHFPLESRNESTEQLLQKMWADSYKRKNAPPKKDKSKAAKSTLFSETDIQEDSESSEEEEVEIVPSVHTVITEEFINASLIQAHERFRQWYMVDYRIKCNRRKTYFAENVQEAPLELKTKAATLIQKIYREFMKIKRQRVLDSRRDMMLGLIPDPWADRLNFEEENNKVYERRRQTRTKVQQIFLKELEKEKIRLVVFKKPNQIDDITEQITTWFREWYHGYGFFPEFPYDVEGGTMMVIRGDYPTIEEKIEADEKYLAATKGKTKEMLKQEKLQAKFDAAMKAEVLKATKKKEAEQLFKLRCNPLADPGYEVKTSEVTGSVVEAFQKYRAAWSIYDKYPPDKCADAFYGYMQQILTEDLMCQIHEDARKYVDELMRLDLKLLIKSHQLMYKQVGWKYPKMPPRPRPKRPPVPKAMNVDHALLKQFEDIFDLGIISKPTAKMKDVYGDSNYAAYELNVRDPDATFPPPGYGDIKNRLILSCIYGIGMDPGVTKNKAVMLLGPPRNGKSFLVDVVAGELNAVKIDITPEVFSAVLDKPAKVLTQVFQAARVFQPTVIYMRNVERVFAKKVAPEAKYLNAKVYKAALTKLLKNLPDEDKVMFIATCSDPNSAQAKPMVSLFDELILVPRTDYGTVQRFFYEKLQSIRSMPRDYCVQPLAQMMQGYGFGLINEVYHQVMNPLRIVRLNITPLSPGEFMEPLIEAGIEPLTIEDYQEYVDFFIQNSSLKKEREEYEVINNIRAAVYTKMAKEKKKK
ncbi:hypothetical protein ABMA27_011298 [Loxostege sticticalis]|uniref:ATPase AAA-type core domain-containing protein n=1 Tax=Loxostege sticticalis TaxID=481309 RepID=A0ABR3H214_LOXSC